MIMIAIGVVALLGAALNWRIVSHFGRILIDSWVIQLPEPFTAQWDWY
jgi:hypothetical protein